MGGSGHCAPWELLRGFEVGVPLILAGGLVSALEPLLARRGGTCQIDEGRRVWVRPRTALTPALREAFADLKPALVAALVGCGRVARGPTPGARTFPCPGCGRALPAVRRTDRDFTVCVCCKLDRIERSRT